MMIINSVFLKINKINGTINKTLIRYALEIKFENLKIVTKNIKSDEVQVNKSKSIHQITSIKRKLSSFTYV